MGPSGPGIISPTNPGPTGATGATGPVGIPANSFTLPITATIAAGTDTPEIHLGTNTSGTTISLTGMGWWYKGAAITGSDTDYVTFALIVRDETDSNPLTIRTATTKTTGGTGNITANVRTDLIAAGSGPNTPVLPDGWSLYLQLTHGGAGKAIGIGAIFVVPPSQ